MFIVFSLADILNFYIDKYINLSHLFIVSEFRKAIHLHDYDNILPNLDVFVSFLHGEFDF